jgi:hypothetical protein
MIVGGGGWGDLSSPTGCFWDAPGVGPPRTPLPLPFGNGT